MKNTVKKNSDPYGSEVNEILASIRQIMSYEDKNEENEKGNLTEIINFPDKRILGLSSSDEDILNLTNVVMKDGSIISLNQREAPMAAETEKQQKTEEKAQTVEPEKKDEIELTEDKSIDSPAVEGASKESAPKETPPKENSPKESAENPKPDLKQEPSKEEVESLMSKDAVAQSSQAFKELGKLNDRMKEKITDDTFGDQTVEQLMRELLRPMLKEWLDSHLPSLVKWLVAEKIEQMIKTEQEKSS